MKTLKFEQVTFGYKKDKRLFQDLSFEITQPVGKGFVIGLMGVSGSGKSTILKLLLGIEKNYAGKISVSPADPVISYVPQEAVLFEHLTPIENAEYFSRIGNHKSNFNRELFNEVSKTLQVEDVLRHAVSVNEISGGQRQRLSLLRAMSIKPDILLLDEPLTGLDEEVKDRFLQTLAILVQRYGLMVIYVTHHRKEAEFISDVILYLEKERNVEVISTAAQTEAKQFFNKPPTVSALNATKEMRVNTLWCVLGESGTIEPIVAPSTSSSAYLISFQEEVIQFSKDSGFEFEVAAETGIYTHLKLKNPEIALTISNDLFKAKSSSPSRYISLSGGIDLYDNIGRFLMTTKIQNNQIVL